MSMTAKLENARSTYGRLDDLITEWVRVAYPASSEEANDLSEEHAEIARQEMLRIGTAIAETLITAPGALQYIKRRAGRND